MVVILIPFTIINAQTGSFTFDSGTLVEDGGVFTETVSSVDMTISQENNSLILIDYLEGFKGTSGKFIYSSTVADQIIINFSQAVDITTIHVASGSGLLGYYWTFTSDQSDSKQIDINNNDGVNAYLGFENVQFIYINHQNPSQGSGDHFVIDNITMLEGLPVELTEFTATLTEEGVELFWSTATEVNNYGFEVERKIDCPNECMDEWETIGFVPGHGNSNSPKTYEFIDTNPPAGLLEYRLKQIDTDGQFEYYNAIAEVNNNLTGLKEELLLSEFGLQQNYPNPFNPSTKINYTIPYNLENGNHATLVSLKVFDMLGREITELVNEYKPAGSYEVQFNAALLSEQMPSGLYFYKFTAGRYSETRKMMLLK